MTDLRAAVEGLRGRFDPDETHGAAWEDAIDAVLALIPEGAVLVTEEGLAAALRYDLADVIEGEEPDDRLHDSWWTTRAAVILARLRETP